MLAKTTPTPITRQLFLKGHGGQKLVLLAKAGKPQGEASLYTPICLQDIIGKMLEREIYNVLLPVVYS